MIALALRVGRALTPTAWITLAVLAAFLIFGGYCAHRGAEDVRDRQAAKNTSQDRAQGLQRAGNGRQQAA